LNSDIWSKDKPLNLEKIAEHFKEKCVFGPEDLQRTALRKAHGVVLEKKASFAKLCNALTPNYNTDRKSVDAGRDVNANAQNSKEVQSAEVVPNVSPNMNVTNTVANATTGSGIPQQGQTKVAAAPIIGNHPETSTTEQDNQLLQAQQNKTSAVAQEVDEDSSKIPWTEKFKRRQAMLR